MLFVRDDGPIRTHPKGVFAAIWWPVSLGMLCSWVCTAMQSLPMSSIVGQFSLGGNWDDKWDTPGMARMSSGEGISLRTWGIVRKVRVSGKGMSRLLSRGDTIKLAMTWHFFGFKLP